VRLSSRRLACELPLLAGVLAVSGGADAFEVPVTPGVRLHDILSLSITNHGTIDHVVNDVGPPTNATTSPSDVVAYP
jgi:hypothetical protein